MAFGAYVLNNLVSGPSGLHAGSKGPEGGRVPETKACRMLVFIYYVLYTPYICIPCTM